MLNRLLAGLTIAACMIAPAYAGPIDASFGNTVRATLANGSVVQYQYNADQTYTMIAPDGAHVSGVWVVRGDQLCSTPDGGTEGCVPLAANKNVGDTWAQTDADGSTVTISIVAGRAQ